MNALDPDSVALALGGGWQPDPQRTTPQQRLMIARAKHGPIAGPGKTLGEPAAHALFGNPDAKVQFSVDASGRPLHTYGPQEFSQAFPGQSHPMADAGLLGASLVTGAPELMARTLVAPVANAIKTGVKSAPLTTATVGGALANTAIPSNSGKTQWEVMNDQWEARRQALNQKIGAEQEIINNANARLNMSPADTARLNKLKDDIVPLQADYERLKLRFNGDESVPAVGRAKAKFIAAQQAIDKYENRPELAALKQQVREVTGPAEERLKGYNKDLTTIGDEIQRSQTPLRQLHPMLTAASFPLFWGAGAVTGNLVGKVARGGQEAKVDKLNDLLARNAAYAGAHTTQAGKTSRNAYQNIEGQLLKGELNNATGRVPYGWEVPAVATAKGAAWGGAEGLLPGLGATAIDAQQAPTGSPLSEASGLAALKSPAWWRSVAPEIGVGMLTGAIGAQKGLGFGRQPNGKMGYGFPQLPQRDVNSAAFVANNVPQWPKPAPKAPAQPKQAAPKGKATKGHELDF